MGGGAANAVEYVTQSSGNAIGSRGNFVDVCFREFTSCCGALKRLCTWRTSDAHAKGKCVCVCVCVRVCVCVCVCVCLCVAYSSSPSVLATTVSTRVCAAPLGTANDASGHAMYHHACSVTRATGRVP
jgi:hypothetical protein